MVAEAYHMWDFVEEEMAARGWGKDALALRMSGDFGVNRLMLDLLETARDDKMTNVIIEGATADKLGEAFGVSPRLFVKLDAQWKALMSREEPSLTENRK